MLGHYALHGVLLAYVCAIHAHAKVVTGDFELTAGGYDSFPLEEITKFSFGVGTSYIRGSFHYPTMGSEARYKSPALLMIDDGMWEKYHNNHDYPTCEDKVKLSTMQIRIGSQSHVGMGHSGLSKMNEVDSTTRDEQGTTHFEFKWVINHADRTHGWFFVVSDCALEQFQGIDKMGYRLEFINEGMNHASAEEHGMLGVYLGSLMLLISGGIYGVFLIGYHIEETERNIHLVVKFLVAAYLLMTAGIVFESIHLFIESNTGFGIGLFDYASELLEMASYLVTAFVLIALASGWTLVDQAAGRQNAYSFMNILQNPKKLVQGFNAVVCVIFAFVVTSVILVICNKQGDGSFHKFHDFESFPGKIMLVMRLVLGGLFAASMGITIRSMNQTKQLSDDKTLRRFLYTLLVVGTSYFVSFPMSVYIAETTLPFYHRHFFVEGSVILSQAAMLLCLAYQFLSQSSVYRRLSTVWESGLLPTAGGLQSIKKINKD